MANKLLKLFEGCSEQIKATALTHSSYAHDKNIASNERLEFLGDSVLQIIVSDYLFKQYKKDEGSMTKIRSAFVCTENLAEIAKSLGLEKQLKLGKSIVGKPISNAILADAMESVIAAIYLTYGLDAIYDVIIATLNIKQKLKSGLRVIDYKSALLELCQNEHKKVSFEIITIKTTSINSTFRANVLVDGEFVAYGQGSNKKIAEQNAAHLAYTKLTKKQ